MLICRWSSIMHRLLILMSLIPATLAFAADDAIAPLTASPEASRSSRVDSQQTPNSVSSDKETSNPQDNGSNNKAKRSAHAAQELRCCAIYKRATGSTKPCTFFSNYCEIIRMPGFVQKFGRLW